jgi:hypothetical protein
MARWKEKTVLAAFCFRWQEGLRADGRPGGQVALALKDGVLRWVILQRRRFGMCAEF